MEKEIFVSVTGIQQDLLSKEQDEIEFISKGKYYEKGNKRYITYKEAQMDDMDEILSTVKIEKDRVTLIRLGDKGNNMLFEIGQKHVTQYATPFGNMELGITTRELDIDLQEERGQIQIKYLLEVNNSPIGINNLTIKIEGDSNKFKLV